MGCRPETTKSRCKSGKKPNKRSKKECVLDNLKDIGREQFFRHYAKSTLPIRDIAGSKKDKCGEARYRGKTEPHIEIGAENYLRTCIQPNIRGFCNNPEKYLFLCTTCKNREVGKGKFLGKRFVVGYIEKKGWKKMGDAHLAVMGKTYMVPFDKKLEYMKLEFKRSSGMQRFNEEYTKKLLRLIHLHENIIADCVKEMIENEKDERQRGKDIPIDNECLKERCEFRDNCIRRKLQ